MMNFHILIVHFPLALFTLYALLEICRSFLDEKKFFYVKGVLLVAGVITGILAIIAGSMIEGDYENSPMAPVLQMHESFAVTLVIMFAIPMVLYCIRWFEIKKLNIVNKYLYKPWLLYTIAVLGLVVITIVGALGGAMAHGKDVDPIVSFIYNLFF